MYASSLDCLGLYTFPNPLSKVQAGGLLLAENLVTNKDGIAESRRGFGPVGTTLGFTTGWIQGIFGYQNRLIVQGAGSSTGSLFFDSTGAQVWTPFASTYVTPTADPYFSATEANKNMFLVGLKQNTPGPGAVTLKMSAFNSEPIPAGVPPGLDGSAALAGAGSGFLGAAEQCAYQVVFGYVDINGNLNLGNPSERILVVNAGGGSDNVVLTFTVPQGLTTSYFYQIYRTPQTTFNVNPALNVPPGAEPQLAAQFNLTAGQIAALSVTVTDVTPDVLLGAALYTNPSQQGALQTNDRPPVATDACLFSQMMFYANTTSLPILNFSMISVGAPNGVQLNDTITVNGIVFTAKAAQNNAAQQFLFVTTGTIAQNIDSTARNLVNCINANANTTFVYAFYLSGFNQLPGLIALQAVSGSTNFAVTSSRGGAYSPVIPPSGTSFSSSTDAAPNGLMVSKVGQPEAVPLVNIIFVGGGDQPILRVLPLRDRVIVIKTDGIFVVTGSSPQNLSVTLLDASIICIARGTAKVLNNSVYLLSQQGVVSITESGVTIQSRQIESDILAPSTIVYSSNTFANLCSAISYESERLYILQIPATSSDKFPTQTFCYNWVTNAWTHWPIDLSYGFVNPFDNRLYVGRPLGLSPTLIYQERKAYTYEDYYDDQIPVTISSVAAPLNNQQIITLAGTPSVAWIGGGLTQSINGVISTAIILAVNVGANQLTVDLVNSTTPNTAIPWTNSPANIEITIPLTYQQAPMTGNFPHYMKIWGRVNFWFNGGNFQSVLAGFLSDVNGPIVQKERLFINVPSSGINAQQKLFLTSGSIWSGVQTDGSPIIVECIGAGGGGGPFSGPRAGGGGGEYRKSTLKYISSTPVNIQIGIGGNGSGQNGSDTIFDTINNTVIAKGGIGGFSGGAGGTGGTGTIGNNGGAGGVSSGGTGGSGGGGAGGPIGVGGAGGIPSGANAFGGGGGGGNGGGSAGQNTVTFTGANGGNNSSGVGHGTGDTGSGVGASSVGGGGGGGESVTSAGGSGSTGIEWDATHGSGGGGGGGGGSQTGGNGGLYGGGGGSFGTGSPPGTSGSGGNGVIVITYNPPSQFPLPIQTIVPQPCSLSRWIMPQLSIAFPRARFSCLGVTASYEIESDVSA